jgi:bacterioferritin-associated ferredoxin
MTRLIDQDQFRPSLREKAFLDLDQGALPACCAPSRPDAVRRTEAIAMIVCSCNVLSDRDVRTVIVAGAPRTPCQVYGCLACIPQCGRCAVTIRRPPVKLEPYPKYSRCLVSAATAASRQMTQ